MSNEIEAKSNNLSADKLAGKLSVGTGDIDNSDNTLKGATVTDSDVAVTTNNLTQIEVKDGGTLKYKDAAAIHAEAEERRKDWDNVTSSVKKGADALYNRSPIGMMQKAGEGLKKAGDDFMAGVDNIGKPKSSRFDKAIDMQTPQNTQNQASNSLSK